MEEAGKTERATRRPGRPRVVPEDHVRLSVTLDRRILGIWVSRFGGGSLPPGRVVSLVIAEVTENESILREVEKKLAGELA